MEKFYARREKLLHSWRAEENLSCPTQTGNSISAPFPRISKHNRTFLGSFRYAIAFICVLPFLLSTPSSADNSLVSSAANNLVASNPLAVNPFVTRPVISKPEVRISSDTSQPKREVVDIGIIAPLSGSTAVYGEDLKRAVELISTGTYASRRHYEYRFLLEDGQCGKGNAAISAFHKLADVSDVKFFIVGCSGEIIQIASNAEKQGLVAIAYAGSHPDITKLGKFIYRAYPDMKLGAVRLAEEILKRTNGKIVLLSEENAFTAGIRDLLVPALNENLIMHEDFPPDETDFRTLLTKARAANPTGYILNAANPRSYQSLYTQLRRLDKTTPVFSYYQPSDKDVMRNLGDLQNNVYLLDVPEGKSNSSEFEDLRARYLELYPDGPISDSIFRSAFDATMSLVAAVEKAGKDRGDTDRVRKELDSLAIPGALGTVRYDNNGDRMGVSFSMKQIQDGHISPIAP